MNPIRLICTDFDGTFVGDQPRPQRLMEFRDLLRPLARQCGTRWAIVTGRRLGDLRPALAEKVKQAAAEDGITVAYWLRRAVVSSLRWRTRRAED